MLQRIWRYAMHFLRPWRGGLEIFPRKGIDGGRPAIWRIFSEQADSGRGKAWSLRVMSLPTLSILNGDKKSGSRGILALHHWHRWEGFAGVHARMTSLAVAGSGHSLGIAPAASQFLVCMLAQDELDCTLANRGQRLVEALHAIAESRVEQLDLDRLCNGGKLAK